MHLVFRVSVSLFLSLSVFLSVSVPASLPAAICICPSQQIHSSFFSRGQGRSPCSRSAGWRFRPPRGLAGQEGGRRKEFSVCQLLLLLRFPGAGTRDDMTDFNGLPRHLDIGLQGGHRATRGLDDRSERGSRGKGSVLTATLSEAEVIGSENGSTQGSRPTEPNLPLP
ncbi:hypothetical protein B0J18DRAFT_151738 [Chaetomium sp. MPI-SDFR-AT-0129]|nr:hypothetical protein B0J18DRAFT_151738 [Chaetomium sp. MPI-SDFR-AT-0129]